VAGRGRNHRSPAITINHHQSPSIDQSVGLYIYLSVYLPLCLSVCLSLQHDSSDCLVRLHNPLPSVEREESRARAVLEPCQSRARACQSCPIFNTRLNRPLLLTNCLTEPMREMAQERIPFIQPMLLPGLSIYARPGSLARCCSLLANSAPNEE
jgi:hypothetical protein